MARFVAVAVAVMGLMSIFVRKAVGL